MDRQGQVRLRKVREWQKGQRAELGAVPLKEGRREIVLDGVVRREGERAERGELGGDERVEKEPVGDASEGERQEVVEDKIRLGVRLRRDVPGREIEGATSDDTEVLEVRESAEERGDGVPALTVDEAVHEETESLERAELGCTLARLERPEERPCADERVARRWEGEPLEEWEQREQGGELGVEHPRLLLELRRRV